MCSAIPIHARWRIGVRAGVRFDGDAAARVISATSPRRFFERIERRIAASRNCSRGPA